jgi:glycosyltransferase involved in cell wall biosynthesis
MKIVKLVPGSGDNFYCENCVRDLALVRALKKAGHEVTVIPMYLPQRIDRLDEASSAPLFFGGINAYLQQQYRLFRMTPRWLDRIFDSRLLLGLAARRAGTVRPSDLGAMTLSMLKGRDGHQKKELERLVRWLEQLGKPDVVHLSNPLLLGLGAEIRSRLGVPIVCSLQDEDAWLDGVTPPYLDRCWQTMADHARNVDAFVAVSRYFGDVMGERMKIAADRLHVAHVGVDPGAFDPSALPQAPPVIGYLARMSESLGLPVLVEAFLKLKETASFQGLRLHVSGGATADDGPYLTRLKHGLAVRRMDGDVTLFEAFDPEARKAFFRSLTVFSVPAPGGVAFGTFLLESLASGVPVVQPRAGAFPELVEATGGGVIYEPNDAAALARAIGELLSDPKRLAELGERGRQAVADAFSPARMAERVLDVYRHVVPSGAMADGRPS